MEGWVSRLKDHERRCDLMAAVLGQECLMRKIASHHSARHGQRPEIRREAKRTEIGNNSQLSDQEVGPYGKNNNHNPDTRAQEEPGCAVSLKKQSS